MLLCVSIRSMKARAALASKGLIMEMQECDTSEVENAQCYVNVQSHACSARGLAMLPHHHSHVRNRTNIPVLFVQRTSPRVAFCTLTVVCHVSMQYVTREGSTSNFNCWEEIEDSFPRI